MKPEMLNKLEESTQECAAEVEAVQEKLDELVDRVAKMARIQAAWAQPDTGVIQ